MNLEELNKVPGTYVVRRVEEKFLGFANSYDHVASTKDAPVERGELDGDWSVEYHPPESNRLFDMRFEFPKTVEKAQKLFDIVFGMYTKKHQAFHNGKMLPGDRIQLKSYYEGVKLLTRVYKRWIEVKEPEVAFLKKA